MPELPEVETVVRGLRPHLQGQRLARVVLRRADIRTPIAPDFVQRVVGAVVQSVERRAKWIVLGLDRGTSVLVHLGMSGRLVLLPGDAPAPGPHDHVDFVTDAGATIRFTDPRRFGVVDALDTADLAADKRFAELGPEPLDAAFDAASLEQALSHTKSPLKSALLDQRNVAGLGNIYVCEALFRAGLSPLRKASTVKGPRAVALCAAIKATLEDAIKAGGSSARDYVQASGELGWFQHQWRVYDREGQPCPGCDCGKSVKRIVQSGRSTFYCPKRQR
ncbi:MAG: bifunctional DNA-formamidopyrimidine glycosylase/DNA-(apurinic or apyrimidinic site) lyase [Magnetospirillum sp.]|jgi:formamidopyrimidine-DNA glycosylase|nr:bifunctional DNA-formamidopyrimidine glycosylase/DNA-(apurinic or apyrimidinic site) lyase [Magnetospirillum sp.]